MLVGLVVVIGGICGIVDSLPPSHEVVVRIVSKSVNANGTAARPWPFFLGDSLFSDLLGNLVEC